MFTPCNFSAPDKQASTLAKHLLDAHGSMNTLHIWNEVRSKKALDIHNWYIDSTYNTDRGELRYDTAIRLYNSSKFGVPFLPNHNPLLHRDKDDTIADAVANQLIAKRLVHRFKGKLYVTGTDDGDFNVSNRALIANEALAVGHLRVWGVADKVSFRFNSNRRTGAISSTVTISPEIEHLQDELAKSVDRDKIMALVMHLKDRIANTDFEFVDIARAEEVLGRRLKPSEKSFYKNGKAYLINSRVTNDIAVEEMLHPFTAMVKSYNFGLYLNLLEMSKRYYKKLVFDIENNYSDKDGFTEGDREMELVTQALARVFRREFETEPTAELHRLVERFLAWFRDLVSGLNEYLYGEQYRIEISDLSHRLTLTQIAKMLNTSDTKFIELRQFVGARIPNLRTQLDGSNGNCGLYT